jgi:hypothetical protein
VRLVGLDVKQSGGDVIRERGGHVSRRFTRFIGRAAV